MDYQEIKEKLNRYYLEKAPVSAGKLKETCYSFLDIYDAEHPEANAYELKTAQYRCITEQLEPVIFGELPFYYETGALHPFSDGLFTRGMIHANGWLRERNLHLQEAWDPERYGEFTELGKEKLHLGGYLDLEHFKTPMKKIFRGGLRCVYEEAQAALLECNTQEETDFINCAISGLLCLKEIAEKFKLVAEAMLQTAINDQERENLQRIAETAGRIPWEKPTSVYEGLETMAFMRKVMGSLEGCGFNSMGRVDALLEPLYVSDREKGVTDEEIYDLICKFLIIWDSHVDKSKIMSGYADYEYENTVTLGGCDKEGNEIFNPITRMFLKAHGELDNMYPKLKCRFSSKSSEAYLSLISNSILHQKSILLYCNDDTIIPAMIKNGFSPEHAWDYTVTGCWGVALDDYYKESGGEYLNTLRALEWSMHMPQEKLKKCGLNFKALAGCKDFEAVYDAVLHNIMEVFRKKAEGEAFGGRNNWQVSPFCLYSSLLMDALKQRKDYTRGGGTYGRENALLAALPDTVDSLLAINELCFVQKVCTLEELLDACRNDWPEESLRQMAMRAPAYGDGSEISSCLLQRMVDDIYDRSRDFPTAFGGSWQLGSYMYTEVLWWGKAMGATPNGRKAGAFLSQGLTPSRLHCIDSVTDVFSSLRYLDTAKLAQGAVINMILPTNRLNPAVMNAFLRSCAQSNTHILQINGVNREDLLAAQRDPERYQHIIVRVCGFSAQFIRLSKDFQDEFLSRNYYQS